MQFAKGKHKHPILNGYGIVTMSGRSARFAEEGYSVPKHRLDAHGQSLFYFAVSSLFEFYHNGYKIIFVTNKQYPNERKFIELYLEKLQIVNVEYVEVDDFTDGQATTALAAKGVILDPTKPVFIYNIDTMITKSELKESYKLSLNPNFDGIIPTANLPGDCWSFVQKSLNDCIYKIVEKRRISNHATLGFYWFKSFNLFEELYKETFQLTFLNKMGFLNKEKYVSSLYHTATNKRLNIIAPPIDSKFVSVFGTPEQYKQFLIN